MTARQALVLAASRPHDPVARHGGQSHKALVPVDGVPMLLRVLRALRESRSVGPIAVCLEADAPVAGAEPELAPLIARGAVTLIDAATSPSHSVLRALETLPLPLLVTTADHPLLSAAMVEHFCAAVPADADVAVAVARASLLRTATPMRSAPTIASPAKATAAATCSCCRRRTRCGWSSSGRGWSGIASGPGG